MVRRLVVIGIVICTVLVIPYILYSQFILFSHVNQSVKYKDIGYIDENDTPYVDYFIYPNTFTDNELNEVINGLNIDITNKDLNVLVIDEDSYVEEVGYELNSDIQYGYFLRKYLVDQSNDVNYVSRVNFMSDNQFISISLQQVEDLISDMGIFNTDIYLYTLERSKGSNILSGLQFYKSKYLTKGNNHFKGRTNHIQSKLNLYMNVNDYFINNLEDMNDTKVSTYSPYKFTLSLARLENNLEKYVLNKGKSLTDTPTLNNYINREISNAFLDVGISKNELTDDIKEQINKYLHSYLITISDKNYIRSDLSLFTYKNYRSLDRELIDNLEQENVINNLSMFKYYLSNIYSLTNYLFNK